MKLIRSPVVIQIYFSLVIIALVSCQIEDKSPSDSVQKTVYSEILQEFLDLDTMQIFLYTPADTPFNPLILVEDASGWKDSLPRVTKFGRQVTFLSKEKADSSNLECYFWVIDFNYHNETARMQLIDPVRNFLFGASFENKKGVWQLYSFYFDDEVTPISK